MRRILRKVASSDYEGLGDLTTLAEPAVVSSLIEEHKEKRKTSRFPGSILGTQNCLFAY
jgi:hypothetical protein